MMKLQNKIFPLLVSFLLFGAINSCFGKDASSPSDYVEGSYFSTPLPTQKEKAELQKLAMSQNIDFEAFLHDMPETEEGWRKFFGVSMLFTKLDRLALVYGYHLFSALSYFCEWSGQKKCAEMINAQPHKIAQRVRDFLYYHAFNPDPKVMRNNERLMREEMSLIFPENYLFSSDDALFENVRLSNQ